MNGNKDDINTASYWACAACISNITSGTYTYDFLESSQSCAEGVLNEEIEPETDETNHYH